MKKIISLFQRNYQGDRLVRDEIVPGAEWVVAGEGVATRKYDGTACMIRDGKLYKRYDAKHGKTPPAEFEPAQEPDEKTGHWPGWIPVGDGPEDNWYRETFDEWATLFMDGSLDGTYELIGPRINSNHEGVTSHSFQRHGNALLLDCPRNFAGIKEYLSAHPYEGIVWHNPDGRMVKIKARDFGLPWPPRK